MENLNGDGRSEKSPQITHLSFIVALLQSIGFEPEPSCSSDPSEVRDLVDFLGNREAPKGTTVTVTCDYSKTKCTLRLPENEETCNCLAANGNEGEPLEVFRNEGDVRGLRDLFNALLKHLRNEFIREATRLKESFELDASLTSIFPNFHNISTTSETFTEFNYRETEEILNETYTVNVLEVPRKPYNKTSVKRYPSAPPATRPELRRSSLGAKPNKRESKQLSPRPKYLKPQQNGKLKSPAQASVKSENFKLPGVPKSPSTLSVKSENLKISTKKSPLAASVKPEILKSKKPMEEKLKNLGIALKKSTTTIRRSFGFTTQNKYVPTVEPSNRLSLSRASTPIPTIIKPQNTSTNTQELTISSNQRSASTDRYTKIPITSSGMVRSQSGVIAKLN